LKSILSKLNINIILLLLVSGLIIILENGEINRDGLLYLGQTQLFVIGDWEKAFLLYTWPFYSFLIAGVHNVTGISLQAAAHSLNLVLFILSCFFFLKTIYLINQNKDSYIFGTLILLTSIPLMDDYLVMIIRDHGLWAGFMIGVYGYLRWVKNPQLTWALTWQLGFIFGTLFRPECLIFNILLPITHQLFIVKCDRFKIFLQSLSVLLIVLLIFLLLGIIYGYEIHLKYLIRLNEYPIRIFTFFKNIIQPLDVHSEDYYLRVLISDFSIGFKYLFFSYVSLYKWVSGLGIFHLFLFLYAINKRLISASYSKAIYIFLIISILVPLINLISTFVIAGRYLVMNYWIVYIFAAIGFNQLWQNVKNNNELNKIITKRALVFICIIYFFNVIIDKPGKNFEKEAGEWVKNNQIPILDIYFTSKRAAYYSGYLDLDYSRDTEIEINTNQYRYLVITYARFDNINEIPNYKKIQYFPSKEKPKVIIYERINNN
jgi:hypothetical protein